MSAKDGTLYPSDVVALVKEHKHDIKMFGYNHAFKLILLSGMFVVSMAIACVQILFF